MSLALPESIEQPVAGYRFSLDPFLLAAFIGSEVRGAGVDLGTGSGILPLLLVAQAPELSVTGVERQPGLAAVARRNLTASPHADRLRLLEGDLRQIGALLPAQSCALVCANPPYRVPGRGRLAADDERAAARHELHGGLADFVAAAAYLLRHGGRFCLIHLPERLPELFEELRRAAIEPKRLRCVHPRQGAPATMVLVEGRMGGRPGLLLDAPLLVRDGEEYTAEVRELYPAEPSSGD